MIRVSIVYVVLLVAMRIIGKRELSQLSPFDLVTLLLIPELFQQALVREDFSMVTALVASATLLSLVYVTSHVTYRLERVGRIIEGQPAVLIASGQLVTRNLDRERVSPDELFAEMHKAGLERLEQVRWAILETDGKISVVPAEGDSSTAPDKDEGVM